MLPAVRLSITQETKEAGKGIAVMHFATWLIQATTVIIEIMN